MKIQTNYLFGYNQLLFNKRLRCPQRPVKPATCQIRCNQKPLHPLDSLLSVNEMTYDSFTGMRDKQYLLATLREMMAKCISSNQPIHIAMFDMDNFKSVNEILGYEVGDNFIKAVSSVISDVSKTEGLNPYRFGGEEFFIIFDADDKKKQDRVLTHVTNRISSNKYISSQTETYRKNAEEKLRQYMSYNSSYERLKDVKYRMEACRYLRENLTTDESIHELDLLSTNVEKELNSLYTVLINDSLESEKDQDSKDMLNHIMRSFNKNNLQLCSTDEENLDDYLKGRYDKNAEYIQIKKWLSDFEKNNGFTITGCVTHFSPGELSGKTPMDLINIAGENLKRKKRLRKGYTDA